jgi:membrane protein YdbS with pleckstrin-like domain
MTAMTVNLILLGVLALVIGAMFMYRHWVEDHEDHNIHLHNNPTEARIIHAQEDDAKKVGTVEKAIRYLIILLVAYAVAVAGYAIYTEWITSQ